MSMTTRDVPTPLMNLTDPVREKAIAIADALLRDGFEENRAIRIAAAQAEDWAHRRHIDVWADRSGARNPHVVPYGERWAVRFEGGELTSGIFETRYEAVELARELALRQEAFVVVHALDGHIHDVLTPN